MMTLLIILKLEKGFICSNSEIASLAETWEQSLLYASTPGNFDDHTRSVYCPSPTHLRTERSTSLPGPGRLGFYDETRTGNGTPYDGDAPTYLNYRIDWKALLNNRSVGTDTEQDLILKPSSYWQKIKEKANVIV
ncbi:conserved hypothetical protein [Talaromyces marneffei ATCC 18224]|uniref:Uncharacterized protein n=1 Tax=Talaromyces marneffei (strain ATCC 18224 / CBS 334.59 / QM 7333) TaxID=441960 RepID=B6QWN1_TALMQ|nr:conserved hypothetical protein [Talaromyces marneffei ATCC 18224]